MRRFFSFFFYLALLYFVFTLLLFPTKMIATAKDTIALCLDVVIPSLFPFLVCSQLFTSLGIAGILSRLFSPTMRPLFGVPGSGALAVVLGLISGYPVGASCIATLYTAGNCTKTEAHRLLTFCNNSGPLFTLGAIGIGMLGNQKLGLLLYLSHTLSAFLVGILFRNRFGESQSVGTIALPPATGEKNFFAALGQSVSVSVDTLLKICGFVLLFAVFTAGLPNLPVTPFLSCLLEITGGIPFLLQADLISPDYILPAISFFLALSGVSILFQTAAIILPAGLSLKPYLLGKTIQAVLSFFLTLFFCRIFPMAQPTVLQGYAWSFPSPKELFSIALAFLLLFSSAIFFLWLIDFLHKSD